MILKKVAVTLSVVAVFATGYFAGSHGGGEGVAYAQSPGRVFELRTYTAHEGKLGNVVARTGFSFDATGAGPTPAPTAREATALREIDADGSFEREAAIK